MVEIAPFRGLRFTSDKKYSDISKYICPPYDVISKEERAQLIKRSQRNIVQLELPSGEGNDKYSQARTILESWTDQNWLQLDRYSSFYLLETTYRIDDAFAPKKKLKRYGVLVSLRLETPGKGAVKPHEKTFPKAKEDRLNLIRKVQTTISPIFGLFFDKKKEWPKWISKVIKKKPLVHGREKKDLEHRMWKVEDPALQVRLRTLLKKKELYIADGHHRYEVSWAYKEERLKGNPSANPRNGWHSMMTYICPIEEAGLLMLPTHRLVKSSKSLQDWQKHLELLFKIEPVKNKKTMVHLLAHPKKGQRVMGWVNQKGIFKLTLKPSLSIDRCLSHRPKALRDLDVTVLHDLALGETSGTNFLGKSQLEFTRDLNKIEKRSKNDPSWVGFLLGSPGVEGMAKVAAAGEVMPPKTTYFYPKVPTGITLMPLDQRIV